MSFERIHKPTIDSILGKFKTEQASYVCRSCDGEKRRVRPRRAELGLAGTSKVTETLERVIGLLGSSTSFDQAAKMLKRITGLSGINAKRIERVTKQLGDKVIAFREAEETAPDPAKKVCLEVDGTGIPMRPEETEGRPGKGKDGVAKTREGKMALAIRSDSETVLYDAGIEPVTSKLDEPTFTDRFLRLAKLSGFDNAEQQVLISDGAEWIPHMVLSHYPNTTTILDFYHAAQHIHAACAEHYAEDSQAKSKFKELKHKMKTGELDSVIRCLQQFGTSKQADYLLKNRHRLDYPSFKAANLPIASARVESACKNVIGTRFKQGGMRWSLKGVRPVLALRCLICSDRLGAYYDASKKARQSWLTDLEQPLAMAA